MLFRVIAKDVIDFLFVFLLTSIFTLVIYYISPSFSHVELSFYFFEKFFELFFVNPKLFIWFLGLGAFISIIYFMFCFMLNNKTLGCLLFGLEIIDEKSLKSLSLSQSILMAIGSYFGVVFLFIGPLYAWWIDLHHRGCSEKLARVSLKRINR